MRPVSVCVVVVTERETRDGCLFQIVQSKGRADVHFSVFFKDYYEIFSIGHPWNLLERLETL